MPAKRPATRGPRDNNADSADAIDGGTVERRRPLGATIVADFFPAVDRECC